MFCYDLSEEDNFFGCKTFSFSVWLFFWSETFSFVIKLFISPWDLFFLPKTFSFHVRLFLFALDFSFPHDTFSLSVKLFLLVWDFFPPREFFYPKSKFLVNDTRRIKQVMQLMLSVVRKTLLKSRKEKSVESKKALVGCVICD